MCDVLIAAAEVFQMHNSSRFMPGPTATGVSRHGKKAIERRQERGPVL